MIPERRNLHLQPRQVALGQLFLGIPALFLYGNSRTRTGSRASMQSHGCPAYRDGKLRAACMEIPRTQYPAFLLFSPGGLAESVFPHPRSSCIERPTEPCGCRAALHIVQYVKRGSWSAPTTGVRRAPSRGADISQTHAISTSASRRLIPEPRGFVAAPPEVDRPPRW
jgi:hypothetical protein